MRGRGDSASRARRRSSAKPGSESISRSLLGEDLLGEESGRARYSTKPAVGESERDIRRYEAASDDRDRAASPSNGAYEAASTPHDRAASPPLPPPNIRTRSASSDHRAPRASPSGLSRSRSASADPGGFSPRESPVAGLLHGVAGLFSSPTHSKSPAAPARPVAVHGAADELVGGFSKRGELLEGLDRSAGGLAEAAREYRENARKERQKAEKARKNRWF